MVDEKPEVLLARIDGNVQHLVDVSKDHEKRIRSVERFRSRLVGATSILTIFFGGLAAWVMKNKGGL